MFWVRASTPLPCACRPQVLLLALCPSRAAEQCSTPPALVNPCLHLLHLLCYLRKHHPRLLCKPQILEDMLRLYVISCLHAIRGELTQDVRSLRGKRCQGMRRRTCFNRRTRYVSNELMPSRCSSACAVMWYSCTLQMPHVNAAHASHTHLR
jgi:hypothetical protein